MLPLNTSLAVVKFRRCSPSRTSTIFGYERSLQLTDNHLKPAPCPLLCALDSLQSFVILLSWFVIVFRQFFGNGSIFNLHIILYICTLVNHMTFLPGCQISLAHGDTWTWLLLTKCVPTAALVFVFIVTFPTMACTGKSRL